MEIKLNINDTIHVKQKTTIGYTTNKYTVTTIDNDIFSVEYSNGNKKTFKTEDLEFFIYADKDINMIKQKDNKKKGIEICTDVIDDEIDFEPDFYKDRIKIRPGSIVSWKNVATNEILTRTVVMPRYIEKPAFTGGGRNYSDTLKTPVILEDNEINYLSELVMESQNRKIGDIIICGEEKWILMG